MLQIYLPSILSEQNPDTSAVQVQVLVFNHSHKEATTDSRYLQGPLVLHPEAFCPAGVKGQECYSFGEETSSDGMCSGVVSGVCEL